jgi:hypothetical protein
MNNFLFNKFLKLNIFQADSQTRPASKIVNNLQSIEEAIININNRFSITDKDVTDEPIFILASGWRSGSTLLQRLINSNQQTLIWGEPFANCNLIQNQTDSLRSFTENYPQDKWLLSNRNNYEKKLHRQVTDNLYPDVLDLIEGYRNLIRTVLKTPAIDRGYQRWGFKEVRLTSKHGIYLKWLFPKAKFLLLYRNPYEAYKSIHHNLGKWNLFSQWPTEQILNVSDFARHWFLLVQGYLEDAQKLEAILIPYENLVRDEGLIADISLYLNLELDRTVIKQKIGSSYHKNQVPKSEIKKLQKIVSPLAEKLGYHPF